HAKSNSACTTSFRARSWKCSSGGYSRTLRTRWSMHSCGARTKYMAPEAMIAIEVVYALMHEQLIVSLAVPVGTTVARALELSRLQDNVPRLAKQIERVGIYG